MPNLTNSWPVVASGDRARSYPSAANARYAREISWVGSQFQQVEAFEEIWSRGVSTVLANVRQRDPNLEHWCRIWAGVSGTCRKTLGCDARTWLDS
jgi:hypothetical protein